MPSRTPDNLNRPLNVTDALTYLDAVKVQFQDKPDVYNNFLDIMKDFKSEVCVHRPYLCPTNTPHSIDTPGVIERVSMLFHGNPALIQGFNTFLPPGYRIEISSDPRDPNVITVTTPMGITTQSTHNFEAARTFKSAIPTPSASIPPYRPLSRSNTPFQMGQVPFEFVAHGLPPSTTAAASFLGALNSKMENRPPGEFNHAIQYLNKIKARYADDPDVYKQFLEILQTYQREQRQLQDVGHLTAAGWLLTFIAQSQVYMQVQVLFKDAPDLLAEFKDFLPEVTVAVAGTSNMVDILPPTAID